MGLKYRSTGGFGVSLIKYAERSTRQLRRVHRNTAERVAEVAAEMAPELTGDLADSMEIMNSRGEMGRVIYTVTYSAPYGIYMHEGVYNLGPISAQKDADGEFRVGRKFMERAAAHVVHTEGFAKQAYKAVRYK
jgi:hypothetical protein